MTFDRQLERTFDAISGLIRAEVSRQVQAVTELTAARPASAAEDPDSTTARLAGGIRAIGAARSLSEILDTLVTCAGLEASRAGILLVRGDRFHGWRFIGFGAAFDTAEAIHVARADAGVIAHAAETATVAAGGVGGDPPAPAFADLPAGRSCAALPLAIGGQTVAVLYADAGGSTSFEPRFSNPEPGALSSEPGTLNLEPLEILSRYAARSLEAMTAIKAARALAAI